MTAQEQEMIGGLIDRVSKTQLTEKDPDAERMLQQGLGRTPDALYILAQTVLVQQYGLEQAQQQLAELRAQLEQAQRQAAEPKHATSFLGGLFGGGASHAPAQQAAPPPPQTQGYGQPQYAPVQGYSPVQGYAPVQGYGGPAMSGGGQGGGFLRGAMQTAAGVAAGALAFEGVESLMHGFGERESGYGSGGQGLGGFGGGERPEVINNYYGDEDRGTNSSGDRDSNNDPGSNIFTEGGRPGQVCGECRGG